MKAQGVFQHLIAAGVELRVGLVLGMRRVEGRLRSKRLNDIALLTKSSQSYTASLASCHTAVPLPPDTSEHALPNPNQTDRYSIYLPRRDGRLS